MDKERFRILEDRRSPLNKKKAEGAVRFSESLQFHTTSIFYTLGNTKMRFSRCKRKKALQSLVCLLLSHGRLGVAFCPKPITPQHFRDSPAIQESLIRRRSANVRTNGESSASSNNSTAASSQVEESWKDKESAASLPRTPGITDSETNENSRRISLMWCDRDKCKDVVRERVVGHNQIILNGPATGQVAYRWKDAETTSGSSTKKALTSKASILFLVKPDHRLFQQAAEVVPQLTQAGIQVLLVPDLAAKLKYKYGVHDDTGCIKLFEPPPETIVIRGDRHVDDDEEKWVQEMPKDNFPDLICTLGGDGLLIYASMLFQGPIPPILSIAGGSLGFMTCFEIEEMVDAIKIALGVSEATTPKTNGSADVVRREEDLDVFPPNMPSYPYEPLTIQRRRQPWQGPKARATFGMDGIICMTVRMRLDCRVVSPSGLVRARYNVLNEVVIDRGSSSYLVALECFCDDVHLTTVQADGIIFAT